MHELQRQCEDFFSVSKKEEEGKVAYEIIVADDGSRDQVAIISNLLINELPHCRYIRRRENIGRAAIRNFLFTESKGELVMYLDSDVEIVREDFIKTYLEAMESNPETDVIDGGVVVTGPSLPHNLRYLYEKKAEPLHYAEQRNREPFMHFHTANIIMSRRVMDKCKFDERFHRYGYEDILLGKRIKEAGFSILHIDNPVGLGQYESNEVFLKKTQDAMLTLKEYESELRGYSNLIDVCDRLRNAHMLWFIQLFHRIFHRIERKKLTSNKPSLTVFNLYKLGIFSTLK